MLVGWLFGLPFQEVALFFGPAILKRKIGSVTYRLNLIPLGGHVFFSNPEFANAPLWATLPTMAAGCIAAFLVAVLCLGPAEAWVMTIEGFRQGILGPLNPKEVGAALVTSAIEFVRTHDFVNILGATATKFCAFNLLPIPSLIGGHLVMQPLRKWFPSFENTFNVLTVVGFLLVLALFVSWWVAVYSACFGWIATAIESRRHAIGVTGRRVFTAG